MGKFIDLTGKRFGRLTVKWYVGMRGHNSFWHCVCDCGNEADVSSHKLRSGHTSSCGCLHNELVSMRSTTHGMTGSRLYSVYASMKSRCHNEHEREYHRYGGRGISVCDEWLNDFGAFHDWSMSHGYDPDAPRGACTLDRIDNDGDYCPENCRWISIRDQNRRRVEVEMTDTDGVTRRFWSIRHAGEVTGHSPGYIRKACSSHLPMKDGTRWRRCGSLKLLDGYGSEEHV